MAENNERPKHFAEKIADLKGIDSRKTTRFFGWLIEWVAYWLSGFALLKLGEQIGKLGKLGIIIVVIAYLYPGCDQRKQAAEDSKKNRHYIAWQTINSAVGKPGNAGRSDALQDLNSDGVSLAGVNLSGGVVFESGLNLANAMMSGADFTDAKFRFPNFASATLTRCNFTNVAILGGNFQNVNLRSAMLINSRISVCDFRTIALPSTPFAGISRFTSFDNAIVSGTRFSLCDFVGVDLGRVNFTNTIFEYCNFCEAPFILENFRGATFKYCNFSDNQMPMGERPTNMIHCFSVNITGHKQWIEWIIKNEEVPAEAWYFIYEQKDEDYFK